MLLALLAILMHHRPLFFLSSMPFYSASRKNVAALEVLLKLQLPRVNHHLSSSKAYPIATTTFIDFKTDILKNGTKNKNLKTKHKNPR